MSDNWKRCPINAWAKLNRTCEACELPHADIEFTFACSGLPDGYMKSGEFAIAWHWNCLPPELKQYQQRSEASMLQAAQSPPGT